MKHLKRVLLIGMFMLIVSFLSACGGVVGEGELMIRSDGTGTRKITGIIYKNDYAEGTGITYFYLKQHGEALQKYLTDVYRDYVPGCEEWLTITVDDSHKDKEVVTLSFAFSKFDEYVEKLSSLAFHEDYKDLFTIPKIIWEDGKIVSYKESVGVQTAILDSICAVVMTDKAIFDRDCTMDGKTENTNLDDSSLAKYGIADFGEDRIGLYVQVDGGASVGIAPLAEKFSYYAEGKEADEVKLTATAAEEWTKLFDRRHETKRTWLAADGIYTAALNGDDSFSSATEDTKTFFIFSDTLMGILGSDGCVQSGWAMPSHTSAILTGNYPKDDKMEFIYGEGGNMVVGQHLFGEKRWMMDCFVVEDNLYIIGFSFQDLKAIGIDLYTIPIRDNEPVYEQFYKTADIAELWYDTEDGRYSYVYGGGVTRNTISAGAPNPDGYIYIYGCRDKLKEGSEKDLIVARIKESEFPDFSKLRYWDGKSWSENIQDSAGILSRVSSEMSVSPVTVGPYAGKYIAVYMEDCVGNRIKYAIGETPYGPFEGGITCYIAPESGQAALSGAGAARYTYNAKAHPHLSTQDKLLISYNVNVVGGSLYPTDGHPRFIWLDLDPKHEYQEETENKENEENTENTGTIESPNVGSNDKVVMISTLVIILSTAIIICIIILRNQKRNKEKSV